MWYCLELFFTREYSFNFLDFTIKKDFINQIKSLLKNKEKFQLLKE